jgi:hypothetical protein
MSKSSAKAASEKAKLDLELFEKDRQVIKFRQGGLTFDEIAQRMGYSHPSGAHMAFKRAMERIADEAIASEGRALHRIRLETALSAIWNQVLKGDLAAIGTMLKILERDAKLYGLDAPMKAELEVTNYDGNILRQRTREIVQAIREVAGQEDSLGERSGETGAAPK